MISPTAQDTYCHMLTGAGWMSFQPQVVKSQRDPPSFLRSDAPLADPAVRIGVRVAGRRKRSRGAPQIPATF